MDVKGRVNGSETQYAGTTETPNKPQTPQSTAGILWSMKVMEQEGKAIAMMDEQRLAQPLNGAKTGSHTQASTSETWGTHPTRTMQGCMPQSDDGRKHRADAMGVTRSGSKHARSSGRLAMPQGRWSHQTNHPKHVLPS